MLKVKDLVVSYGTKAVVDHVSFQVQEGDWLMIVGPNGAGKSTILNAITQGVDYQGEVLLNGTDIRRKKAIERAREVGVLAQRHHVGYEFTVEEIVRLGRYAHSSHLLAGGKDADEAAVTHALQLTGMDEKRHQSILTLSGGEQQRTFLAQVFAQNPPLLLLDEPTNHLDLVYQKQVFELIREWLKTPGRAVVSVVHDLSLAKAFGNRALLMEHGKPVVQGSVEEVLSSKRLDPVYGMDVCDWMQQMLGQWISEEKEANEDTV